MSEAERAARIARGDRYAWRVDMAKAVAVTPGLSRGPLRDARTRGDVACDDHAFELAEEWTPARGRSDGGLLWRDEIAGVVTADPLSHGDVILARKDAPASYHLAVTVDDAAQGVTHVIRGIDLFDATHVHRLLQALLGLPTPTYHHHALRTGPDGQRLAKRHGAPSLESLRLAGEDGRALADSLRIGQAIGIAAASA